MHSWGKGERRKALLDNCAGSALIAALLLVAVSGILGATILFATSTELQISGNYRRAVQTFYAAEAGLAETQQRLSGSLLFNPVFLGDSALPQQPEWSAYIFSKAGWSPTDDGTYLATLTNYVPVLGNATNTVVVPNSVQDEMAYWTKVHHKTEYDAEQAGHRLSTTHYVDGDGSLTLHSTSNRGELIRYGYPRSTSVKAEQFTTTLMNMYPPVDVITSHGQVEGAEAILQADVRHPAGPPVWAPVYVGNEILLAGSMITVQGTDVCGNLPSGLPPISLGPMASLVGTATLTGNPTIPQGSPISLDLDQQINAMKYGAIPIPHDLMSVTLGSGTSPGLFYAEPTSGILNVSQATGYGMLLVKGHVQIAAPFHWEGFVLVSGRVTFTGGLGSAMLQGALYANQAHVLHDDVSFLLNTCSLEITLRTLPVQIMNWRQLL